MALPSNPPSPLQTAFPERSRPPRGSGGWCCGQTGGIFGSGAKMQLFPPHSTIYFTITEASFYQRGGGLSEMGAPTFSGSTLAQTRQNSPESGHFRDVGYFDSMTLPKIWPPLRANIANNSRHLILKRKPFFTFYFNLFSYKFEIEFFQQMGLWSLFAVHFFFLDLHFSFDWHIFSGTI